MIAPELTVLFKTWMFDIDSTNKLVHLTNDAIQSHSSEYGKF